MNWIIINLITNKRNNNIIYAIVIGLLLISFSDLIENREINIAISIFVLLVSIIKGTMDFWYRNLDKRNQKIIEKIKDLAKNANYEEIINLAEKVKIIKPHIAEKKYWLGYAFLYKKNSNSKKALDYFKGLEKEFPFLSSLFYLKGIALIDENRLEEAINELSLSIKLENNWQNYEQRGVAYLKLEKYELAEKDLEKSVYLKKDCSNLDNLGVLFDRQGKHKEAIDFYNKSIDLNNNNPNAFYNRALANFYIKKYDNAILDNTETIKLEPNRAWAYYNRALCFQELGKYDLAITDFNKAEELEIKDKYLYLNRGICKSENNEIKEGLNDLKKAVGLDCSEASELIKKYENK